MKLAKNIILNTDSYRVSMFKQYPAGTTGVYSYIESRGGRYDTPKKLSAVYYGAKSETPEHLLFNMRNDTFVEPEIVFFPDIKGLAIQGHPEWDEINSDFVNKTNELVVEYLFNKEW